MPNMLSTRPTRSVPYEKPFSFVMGPELLSKIPKCQSLSEVLSSVLALSDYTVNNRINLTKSGELDHFLLLFSSDSIAVQPATLEGINLLLKEEHSETARRVSQVLPRLDLLRGPDNFQKRIDAFSQHWDNWNEEVACMWVGKDSHRDKNSGQLVCNCRYVSFESYCREFDEAEGDADKQLLLTREMLVKLLGCNELCGFDGITYDKHGHPGDKEYLAKNVNIEQNDRVSKILLSSIDRFKV